MIQECSYDGLPCVELTYEENNALICPGVGGNCIRLHLGKADLLRTPATAAELLAQPCVYGSPLLLPPNRIADGRILWQNRVYQLPINEPTRQNHIHGYLSDAPFAVVSQCESRSCAQIALSYDASMDGRYASQGLDFRVELTYRLSADGLKQTVQIRNGAQPLPLGFGQHTALRAPFLRGATPERTRLSIPVEKEWMIDRERIHPTGQAARTPLCDALNQGTLTPCEHSLSALFTLCGDTVSLTDGVSGASIGMKLKGYPFMMLWNQNGSREFVCCEPQTWLVNAPHLPLPAEDTGFCPFEPGEERAYEILFFSTHDR